MKKLFLLMVCMLTGLTLSAQMVNPIHWTGETRGDSIYLTATIDEGWHLNIIDIPADGDFDEEYAGTFSVTLPNTGEVEVRYNACDDKQCIAPETFAYTPTSGDAQTVSQAEIAASGDPAAEEDGSESEAGSNLWMVFLMGLLGGLMAIFTPCVWPIIPMTVSFFIKRNGAARGTTNASAIRDALFYGLSIILIYVGLGLLITLIFGASALNALSTNAVVNIIFFLILVVFAASFFGAFEITLPSSWSTALNAKSSKTSGFLSIMLMEVISQHIHCNINRQSLALPV